MLTMLASLMTEKGSAESRDYNASSIESQKPTACRMSERCEGLEIPWKGAV